jgi:hypothetical protein
MLPILTRILLPKSARLGKNPRTPVWFVTASMSLAAVGMMLTGCSGSSTSGVKAGPISMTNASGLTAPSAALSIGSKLTLSMMPSNDTANAGVDWTVTCGGNPVSGSITNGACGTFSPAHTADGATTLFTAPSVAPAGATVTITATVTSNPSQSSSASLTILSTPIAVSFFAMPPSSLQVSTTTSPGAVVTNDPNVAGVMWTATCGAAACGSFNPATTLSNSRTTYTAPSVVPSGNTVTITATSVTDTTKSISATVTITGPPPPPPPPLPIAVTVLPANIYVLTSGQLRSGHLAAVVSNDSANAGVDWTATCSTTNCGTITSHTASGTSATFTNNSTVPVGGTITITAKSTTDPTKSAVATANVVAAAPISVTLSTAPPATLNTGALATLAATASSGTDGVNWTATCGSAGSCGSFSFSPAHTASGGQIVYTAPATVPSGNIVTITASSAATTPSDAAFATTTIVQSAPSLPSLSFTSAPPTFLVSATQAPVSVTVANDVAPGGVTWTVKCNSTVPGGCGWFAPSQTASGGTAIYTAPPVSTAGTSVTLTATPVADPSISISSSPITIAPDTTLKVNFIPSLPSQMQTDATVNLIAAVANDPSTAGVDWQVCASGCGFFTIKPAVPEILATSTTPFVPPVPAVTATAVTAWPNGLPIPYTSPLQVPSTGNVAVIVSAHADTSTANSGTIAISPVSGAPALHGIVQVGTQPVAGTSVVLYAAGTSGYGSLATPVAPAVLTDSSGNFTIEGSYTCPQPGSQVYLVATGGAIGTNDPNPNRVLMTALGSCSNLSSSSVTINEPTTVASAFATSPFAANDALTGNSSYLYLGASSTNLIGLANAFAAVNNLVDISTGKVKFTVPAGNAAVPYVEINTIADFLNACAATTGGVEGDGSACSTLLTATDLLGTGTFSGSIAPADTLQAVFNLAQHLVSNYGYRLDRASNLIGLATTGSPFQPILTKQPNDWSISLNYISGGGLSTASAVGSFAVDATGNLWITDTKANTVIEWNTFGAALSPATGFPAGGGPIAIDATSNVWISGNGALSELTNLGSPLPWSPFGGVPNGGEDLAFDAQSNLWITNTTGINEFNSLGQQLSPVTGFTVAGIANLTAVGIDSSNNVWIGASANGGAVTQGYLAELSDPGGQLITDTQATSDQYLPQMAADGAGDVWFVRNGDVVEVHPYGGTGSVLSETPYLPGGSSVVGGIDLAGIRGIALDGAGTVWVAGQGGPSGNANIPPGLLPIMTTGDASPTSATSYQSSSLAAGPIRVAVDGSGNVWVLLANNTVTEYVGAAIPVVTPLALGVQTKKLGAKP